MKSSVTTVQWGSVGVLLLVTFLLPDFAMTDSHHREVRQVATTCSTTGKSLSNTSCCGTFSRPSLSLPYNYFMSANEISGHCCRDRFTYSSTAIFAYTYTVTNYPNRCFCDSTLPACHTPAEDPCMAGRVRVDDSTGQCGKLTVSGRNVNYTSSPQEKSGVCCRLNAMVDGQSVPNVINSVSMLPGSCYCRYSTTPPTNTSPPLTSPPSSLNAPPTSLPPNSTSLPPTTPLASTTLTPTTPPASTTLPPTTPPASTTLLPPSPAVSTTPPVSTSSPPITTPSTIAPTITSTTASTTTTAPSCTVTKTPVAATRNNTCCGSLRVYTSFNLALYTFSKQEKSGSCCRMNPLSSSQTALKSMSTYPGDCYCDKKSAPECFDACPVPGFARMSGGTVLTDPCVRPGIVAFFDAKNNLVCHGVYIYDPAGPVAFLPVLYMPATCAEFFSQMDAYILYGKSTNATLSWTDQVFPEDPPVAGLSAFLPTPTVIDSLQDSCAGPACAYNPVNMSSLIILSGCKLYSYGYTRDASGYPTYTGEFRSASVALENPATCQSTTAGAVYKCWKFTDASFFPCNADTGAPIYCPLATGEWVLYGLLDLVATCGTSASFAVVPVSPAA